VSSATPTLAHRLQDGTVAAVAFLLRIVPEVVAQGLGWGLGWLAGSVLRVRRRVVDENLARAFPRESKRWRRRVAARVFPHIGREAVTLLRLAGASPADIRSRTQVQGFDAVEEALAQGKGILFLTGHLGNWEIGGGGTSARGIPLDVVARTQRNPLIDARLNASRAQLGMEVIDRKEAPRKVLRALRKGRGVALVADQNVRRGDFFVEFFGTPASTARGPALFARRTGAPVFLAFPLRLPGWRARYRIRFQPLRVPRGPEGDDEGFDRRLTRAYLAELEAEIRKAPEQYFWPHKRWKTRPSREGDNEEPTASEPV
jgi:Kdo2-lipid IVA lauroyltransferase/acyltransferase